MSECVLPELPLPTVEALMEQLGEVEDRAWDAVARAEACEFLMGNLLLALHATGVVDARALIDRLLLKTSNMDNGQARLGIQDFLQGLKLTIASDTGNGGAGNRTYTNH